MDSPELFELISLIWLHLKLDVHVFLSSSYPVTKLKVKQTIY
jgi:hypothetical protein